MNDLSEASREPSSRRLECVVMKFGGTSVEDADAIRRVCQLAARPSPYRPVVVVSALSKVTDQLMNAGWAAAEGRLESARESLQTLQQRHEAVASDLLAGEKCGSPSRELGEEFQLLNNVLSKIAWEKAFTPQSQDQLLGVGRGGSDFSASIVGAGLQANRIEIWTDVDGIMTTDPNLCPDACRVARMSFDEAADLAYFGAKVLHPATLVPAMRSNVPVWVLNSRKPDCPGTEIVAHCESSGGVKAITAKRGVAIVDVEPVRWFAPELLREVFDVFERHQHSLDLLAASRGSLALLVSSVTALPAIAEELKGMANVRWKNHKALVCLVGEQVRRHPEIAGRAFRAVGDIDVRMICQGASERNISFLVDESQAVEAVRRLHRAFFSTPQPATEYSPSLAMCQAEGAWQ